MSVNLYNFEPFDEFLSSFLKPKKYNYTPTMHFAKNNLLKTKSVYQVEQNREYIASAMLERYVYHNLKAFLLSNEKAPYFEKAVHFDYLPDWAKEREKDGKDVHIFCKDKISDDIKENMETVCDFMYDTALSYVDKRIELFKSTQKKDKEIKINLDSLKTINEYADFNSLLNAAKKGDAYKRKQEEKAIKAAEFLKDSLYGTESVMAFDDGMQILELKSKVALDFESREMCHCVGDGEYDDNDGQKIDIFSLRDEKGHPHVTLELRNGVLKQCKAYGNKKPKEEYLAYIREFVQTNDIEISSDMKFLGMFKQDGKYYTYDNLPKGFVYKGMLDLSGIGLKKLPDMSHIEVTGSFICDRNHLTDLKGAPYKVGGSFFVSSNSLKSLEGAPIYVGEDFYC
ncbi:MAG: PcfJ domain-containing protein [Alphaproteobacteria bacterium]|nr:PcfJ domain-containing protein [Alphaproteobacteria bacterium]